jgi:hypothetical protein
MSLAVLESTVPIWVMDTMGAQQWQLGKCNNSSTYFTSVLFNTCTCISSSSGSELWYRHVCIKNWVPLMPLLGGVGGARGCRFCTITLPLLARLNRTEFAIFTCFHGFREITRFPRNSTCRIFFHFPNGESFKKNYSCYW